MSIWGAIFSGISSWATSRSNRRSEERQFEQGLVNMRERGDEDRRTAMFMSDLNRYDEALNRQRKKKGLENYMQFGQNRFDFMQNYQPVNPYGEDPQRPNYDDYRYREDE